MSRPRRIVVIGPECTGKTRLAADLARHYATVWSPEYAREYLDRRGRPLDAGDVEAIARGQMEGEDAALARGGTLVFHDTDLLSTVVYSRHYYGSCPEWVEKAAAQRLADLYLLLHPDVPWEPDGLQRDRPYRRQELLALFREALVFSGANLSDILGSWSERWKRSLRAVDERLGRD